MKAGVKIMVGRINGQKVVTFAKSLSGEMVMPARFERMPDGVEACSFWDMWITPRERFRRWKIARKAWKTRKYKNQIDLGI